MDRTWALSARVHYSGVFPWIILVSKQNTGFHIFTHLISTHTLFTFTPPLLFVSFAPPIGFLPPNCQPAHPYICVCICTHVCILRFHMWGNNYLSICPQSHLLLPPSFWLFLSHSHNICPAPYVLHVPFVFDFRLSFTRYTEVLAIPGLG